MATETVTIDLPLSIFYSLKELADASSWSLEEVVLQCIQSGMPPLLTKVPKEDHAELLALNNLPDRELLILIESESEADDSADVAQTDQQIMRRAYAYALLRWRGHPLPDPHEYLF